MIFISHSRLTTQFEIKTLSVPVGTNRHQCLLIPADTSKCWHQLKGINTYQHRWVPILTSINTYLQVRCLSMPVAPSQTAGSFNPCSPGSVLKDLTQVSKNNSIHVLLT